VLLHTNGHGGFGGPNNESQLLCYPGDEVIGVRELGDLLANFNPYRSLMVLMQQCHAGGFNDSVADNRVAQDTSIASACREGNKSSCHEFSVFARDWIGALAGSDPKGVPLQHDPDTDGDGTVSAREAFDYANGIHAPEDSPLYTVANNGDASVLGRPLLWWPNRPVSLDPSLREAWPGLSLLTEAEVQARLVEIEKLEGKFAEDTLQTIERYRKDLMKLL
jgi:hypothetical protein